MVQSSSIPAHSNGELSRLNIASVGGGFEQGLSRHASFRLEGSGFARPCTMKAFSRIRVLAGVSVPIGGYRANSDSNKRRRSWAGFLRHGVRGDDGRMRTRHRGYVRKSFPGRSVPSPVPLHAPYIWDTREELVVWTDNAVSRGSFSIDDMDSNGAIAIQFTGASGQAGGTLVLRGPDVVPPAPSIRAVRIRYQWLQDSPSSSDLSLSVTIDASERSKRRCSTSAFPIAESRAGLEGD